MLIKSLTLLLTLRCIASCAHCATESSPDRVEELDAVLAARVVEEAADLGLSIVLSGGEPMLRFPLLLQLADRGRLRGVSVSVSTNGYWAQTPLAAERIVNQLAACGVNTLLLSTDRYHIPFVSFEAVENAARAAVAIGVHCEVAIPSSADDEVSSKLARRLNLLPTVFIKVHPVFRSGRAFQLESGAFTYGLHDQPCGVIGKLVLLPDGYLYACCAGSIHFGRQSVLCAGCCHTTSLRDLIAHWLTHPFLDDIQHYGPFRTAFREAERNERFSLELLQRYTDLCAECETVCKAYDRTIYQTP